MAESERRLRALQDSLVATARARRVRQTPNTAVSHQPTAAHPAVPHQPPNIGGITPDQIRNKQGGHLRCDPDEITAMFRYMTVTRFDTSNERDKSLELLERMVGQTRLRERYDRLWCDNASKKVWNKFSPWIRTKLRDESGGLLPRSCEWPAVWADWSGKFWRTEREWVIDIMRDLRESVEGELASEDGSGLRDPSQESSVTTTSHTSTQSDTTAAQSGHGPLRDLIDGITWEVVRRVDGLLQHAGQGVARRDNIVIEPVRHAHEIPVVIGASGRWAEIPLRAGPEQGIGRVQVFDCWYCREDGHIFDRRRCERGINEV